MIAALALLVVPWRWHQRFARAAVPHALRHLPLVGSAALVLGSLVMAAVVLGTEPGGPG